MGMLWSIGFIGAAILVTIAFVSAYYTGKAELTVKQMLTQREVLWSFWGSYLCWNIPGIFDPSLSHLRVIVTILLFIGAWTILIPLVHNLGLRRKQAQRDK